jgi:uncharacterized membrane protein YcaP (DUF421 family)
MEIVLRAAVIYVFLWVLLRAVGKRELSQLSAFDLVLLIVMGDLIQQGVTQEDMSLTGNALAVCTMAVILVASSWLSFRWRPVRKVLEGVPVVVSKDGQIFEDVLRNERLTVDDLREAAREQQVGDLADVDWAVLEPDGKVSFVTKQAP